MTEKKGSPTVSKISSGKLPYTHDPRTFHLAKYINDEPIKTVPAECNWGRKIKRGGWGTFANLKINNCTCAAAAHLMMTWTSSIGKLYQPTTKAVVEAYTHLTGYDPKKDGIGNPVEARKALKYWRKNGIADRKIIAFAKLDFKDREQLKQAIYFYGGCYVGINLPKSAEKQYNKNKKWTMPRGGAKGFGEKGSWIGHALIINGYKNDELQAITWGKKIIMTLDFWETYVDEAYAIFSDDFISNKETPTKMSVDVLRKDIQELKKKED